MPLKCFKARKAARQPNGYAGKGFRISNVKFANECADQFIVDPNIFT